jgi:LPXTG-motif cell wall-anchored protein
MRTRLRLGAAAAVGLGALLLATVLASPALAWHSDVSVDADCFEGHVRVAYTVTSWKEGHEAKVRVFYVLDGEKVELPSGEFTEESPAFSGYFDLPAGTTGEINVVAVAHWKSGEKSKDSGSDDLPAADECKEETTTTPTTAPPTTAPPTSDTEPTSSTAPEQPTTTVAVGAATNTTAGGQLPFTGAGSSQPMLLAGIALIGGGALFLLLSRERRATR